ncbi:MAG: DUF4417 domain-containing protein [Prevotella sp.]|nr:DUF4417 domain-containing protein [Prevotella sp.]
MSSKYILFSSLEEYNKQVEEYISSFSGKHAKRMKNIENAMNYFLTDIYGYLPTAGEMKWPVLEPNFKTTTTSLLPFNEAWSYKATECIVHFYIDDELFLRVFRNPEKYIPFLCQCEGVIGPDMSQYTDMPAEMRYRHAYCNAYLSMLIQKEGGNLYPNITWSKSDSYWYSYPENFQNSVIAINSNGVHKNGLALYRWRQGYNMALIRLSPQQIIRYGQVVDGENTLISTYHINERLNMLRNGCKRK